MDHVTLPLGDFVHWKGVDFMTFLLYESALLTCDEDVVADTEYFELWTSFANAVYLMHHGRFDDQKKEDARFFLEQFAERYLRKFKATNAVGNFHKFQHAPDLWKKHGPAFLWDAFNHERLLGIIKRSVTVRNYKESL
jgi:hypothetical protein